MTYCRLARSSSTETSGVPSQISNKALETPDWFKYTLLISVNAYSLVSSLGSSDIIFTASEMAI